MPDTRTGSIITALNTALPAPTEDSANWYWQRNQNHIHSRERWFGSDGDGTMSVANNLTPWTLIAGAGQAYGVEVQLSDGSVAAELLIADYGVTPVEFDLHRIFVQQSSANDKNYMIQIWISQDAVFGNASLAFEVPYRSSANSVETQPISCRMAPQIIASNIWARVKCETDAATLALLIGIHCYPFD